MLILYYESIVNGQTWRMIASVYGWTLDDLMCMNKQADRPDCEYNRTPERTTHMFQISKKRITGRTAYSLLLDDIEKARYDLALAYDNFENAMDPDLIDYCIYQVNAMHMRYKFLLSEAKQLNKDSYAKNPLELSEP